MRKLLLLSLLFTSYNAFCANKDMPEGKWREVKRTAANSKAPVSFTDTIFINFLVGNEYTWQKRNSFMYRGTYKLEDKTLDMGSRVFTVVKDEPNRLVLKDDEGTFEFMPDRSVPQGAGKPYDNKEHYNTVKSIDVMVGHWSTFKSTSSKQQSAIDYSRKIKAIDITGGSSDGKLGYVYSTADGDNNPSWYINSFSNQILSCGGKDNRSLKVLKCEGGELIIQEGDMTYFFKQFK